MLYGTARQSPRDFWMTLNQRLKEIKERAEAATKGPWGIRYDFDYYLGGTYIGAGPEKYVKDPERPTTNHRVSCDIQEVEYFEQDVCKV